mmetsp:Transcript_76674/g.228570  ORF Transcript_76674/g.228570 Transcript_76674/m.228570 type:complete len:237 (+) Transcript_76674:304-1014(+)
MPQADALALGEATDWLPAHRAADLLHHPSVRAAAVEGVPALKSEEAMRGQDLLEVDGRTRELWRQVGQLLQTDRALARGVHSQVVAEREPSLGRLRKDPSEFSARSPNLRSLLHAAVMHQEEHQAQCHGDAADGNQRAHQLVRQHVVGGHLVDHCTVKDYVAAADRDGQHRAQEDVRGGDHRQMPLPGAILRQEEADGDCDTSHRQDREEDAGRHHHVQEPPRNEGCADCGKHGQE